LAVHNFPINIALTPIRYLYDMADARIDGAIAVIAVPLDRRLLWEALQAAGAPVDYTGGHYLPEGNKLLAGVGDRVIALVVVDNARDDGLRIGRLTSPQKQTFCLITIQAKPASASKRSATMERWLHFVIRLV
jgi:hypothetical protein